MHVSLSFPWRRSFRHHCSVHRYEVAGWKPRAGDFNSAPAECREAPIFDEQDQWLASCGQRFGESASVHHAYKAWQCRAYYD
jgi:hypothetical protein